MKKRLFLIASVFTMFFIGIGNVKADNNYSYWNIEGQSLKEKLIPYVVDKFIEDGNLSQSAELWCEDDNHLDDFDSMDECKTSYLTSEADTRLELKELEFNNNHYSESVVNSDYFMSVDLSKEEAGDVVAYLTMEEGKITKVEIGSSYDILLNQNSSLLFANLNKLETIEGLDHISTKDVTNMQNMFANDSEITSLNLLSFDTRKAIDMTGMFSNMESIETLDLSSFVTGRLTNTSSMFNGDTNLTTILTSGLFYTGNITSSEDMFLDCTSLKGGNNTVYNENKTDREYARIDSGEKLGYFSKKDLSEKAILTNENLVKIENQVYTGTTIEPIVSLEYYGIPLEKNVDYTVDIESTNAASENGTGQYNITITGMDNYSGVISTSFNVTAVDIDEVSTVENVESLEYGLGTEVVQDDLSVYHGNTKLVEGTDYEVSYSNNVNAGTATITITGINNYTGTKTVEFDIYKSDISEAVIASGYELEDLGYTIRYKYHDISSQGYTGNEIKPNFQVYFNEIELEKDKDYTVSYSNNTNAGTATITVTGKGNFEGSVSTSFKIKQATISNLPNLSEYKYTGSAIKPNIKFYSNGKQLVENKDYVLSYSNNTNTGLATVTVRGIGNYTGTKSTNFVIVPTKISNLHETDRTQGSIYLSWNKASGNVSGYSVYKYIVAKKQKIFIGNTTNTNYGVKKLKEGTTYQFRVVPYRIVNGKTYYGEDIAITTSTRTLKPSIKLSSKVKKVTIKWNKVSGASGYEVYMSTKKNSGYKKIKTTTGKSFTKTKLTRRKKYYFKVRTYRKVNGKTIYSYFSPIKSIKVK